MSNITMTIKVEAPDLVAALMRLTAVVNPGPNTPTASTPALQMPAPIASSTQPPITTPAAVAAAPAVPVTPQAFAVAPVPPVAAPAPAAQVTPAVPVTTAPTYTLDQIAKAGASLASAGKMEPLLGLLSRYGVQAVTQLAPEQYGAFATELRALGAQI